MVHLSSNGVPVPESNPVMMMITATIYSAIRTRYELSRISNTRTVTTLSKHTDGDDVYYPFNLV